MVLVCWITPIPANTEDTATVAADFEQPRVKFAACRSHGPRIAPRDQPDIEIADRGCACRLDAKHDGLVLQRDRDVLRVDIDQRPHFVKLPVAILALIAD